jgi:hypothetical protein
MKPKNVKSKFLILSLKVRQSKRIARIKWCDKEKKMHNRRLALDFHKYIKTWFFIRKRSEYKDEENAMLT